MPPLNRSFVGYALASCAYAASRKTLLLWDAKIERRVGSTYKVSDMLLGEKLYVFGVSTILAPIMTPLYVKNDLDRIDIYMKGANPCDYGYGNTAIFLIEHVFA